MQEILASAKPRMLPCCGTVSPRDIEISPLSLSLVRVIQSIKVIKFKGSEIYYITVSSPPHLHGLVCSTQSTTYTVYHLRVSCVPATSQVNVAVKLKPKPESATDPLQYGRFLSGTKEFDCQQGASVRFTKPAPHFTFLISPSHPSALLLPPCHTARRQPRPLSISSRRSLAREICHVYKVHNLR